MKFYKSIVFCLITLSVINISARSKRIQVMPALRSELNDVLRHTDGLHSACVKQDEKLIESATVGVITSLQKAEKHSAMAQVQQTHLVKILLAAKDKLEMSQNFSGNKKREPLREAFKDLVQIAQVFKLKHYNVFFCSKDKALWLQASSRPKNPINPKRFAKCGRIVR